MDVKDLLAGESFGELALISNEPRAATIKCAANCYFALMHKNDYDKFLKRKMQKNLQKDIDLFYGLPYF